MIQVATFRISSSLFRPSQEKEANEFLRTHKSQGQIHFNRDTIVVFYDNGQYPAAHQIADLQEMLQANADARFQQESTLNVLNVQVADLKEERSKLNATHNKGRCEDIDNLLVSKANDISLTRQAIALQDIKAGF